MRWQKYHRQRTSIRAMSCIGSGFRWCRPDRDDKALQSEEQHKQNDCGSDDYRASFFMLHAAPKVANVTAD